MNQHRQIISNADKLYNRFMDCRKLSEALCAPLSDADATVQSMEDASPAKWHLAHTSWFFETFILRDISDYSLYDDDYPYLFNSYYEAEGKRHSRDARGLITRPSLDEISEYRNYVTRAIADRFGDLTKNALQLIELGINHEQQHQELLLTDILHLLSCNPLYPAYRADKPAIAPATQPISWMEGPSGKSSIGHDGDGFAFDCEGPAHDILLEPYAIADRTITNGEWLKFIETDGYSQPEYWLSDGWAWVNKEDIKAPLYWVKRDDGWYEFSLYGLNPLDINAPASHISLYEADAFASWAAQNLRGCSDVRLPTEGEWEALANQQCDALEDSKKIFSTLEGDTDFFDERWDSSRWDSSRWEWTGSAYRPYPRFKAIEGAVGEYNGKFMSGQFVLKGGSCATPRGHLRTSYRNFFYPHQRWQFTGLRLAKYL